MKFTGRKVKAKQEQRLKLYFNLVCENRDFGICEKFRVRRKIFRVHTFSTFQKSNQNF